MGFLMSLLSFLPQMLLMLQIALTLYRDLFFCIFLQTFVFVAFNKVCTSQARTLLGSNAALLTTHSVLPMVSLCSASGSSLVFYQLEKGPWTVCGLVWSAGASVSPPMSR